MKEISNTKVRNDRYALEIEELLGSKARLRILRLFAKYPNHTFTQYKICQATGLKRQAASKHLEKLLEEHLVASRRGAITTYYFNINNDQANALRECFVKMFRTQKQSQSHYSNTEP